MNGDKIDSFMGLRISWSDVIEYQDNIRDKLKSKKFYQRRKKKVYFDSDLNEWL